MTRRSWPLVAAILVALAGVPLPGHAVAADTPGDPLPADQVLRLAEFAFDPLVQEPALPGGWDRSLSGAPDLHLVQFDGPIPGDAPARLQAAGLEPLRYIYPNTYIVWGLGADRDTLRGAPGIRWTGDFAPAYRAAQPLRDRRGTLLDVRVLIYRGAGADSVVAALSRLGAAIGGRTVDRRHVRDRRVPASRRAHALRGRAPRGLLDPADGGDWSARAEVSAQINVNNVDENSFAVPGYRTG